MIPPGRDALHAFVRLVSPDGAVHELVHGDLIGRVWSASLQINDARVSEAHAMVSLREGELQLIGLRGAFAVDGNPVGEVTLTPGLRVLLASGVALQILDVQLPVAVLGLEGPGLPPVMLPGVCALVPGHPIRLCRGTRQDALATIWNDGEDWWIRQGDEGRRLRAGDQLEVGGHSLTTVLIPLGDAGPGPTIARTLSPPLELVVRYDTVHVHREGHAPVMLSGNQARLVSELAACGAPIDWLALARQLWRDDAPAPQLRSRLDVVMSRIRRLLRVQGVRTNLVRTDGAGLVELLLYPDDHLKDES
jgi:hypothetical protein